MDFPSERVSGIKTASRINTCHAASKRKLIVIQKLAHEITGAKKTENKLRRHRRITCSAIILLLRFVAVYCLYRAPMAWWNTLAKKRQIYRWRLRLFVYLFAQLRVVRGAHKMHACTQTWARTHTHTHYTHRVVHVAKNRSNCIVLTLLGTPVQQIYR